MTPAETKKKTEDIYEDLQKLKRIKIGLGNYMEVMNTYQKLFGELISCVHELAEDVDALMPKDIKALEQ